MRLRRDASTGRILDGSNPIILVGGHYHLFQTKGQGDYGLDLGNKLPLDPTPVIWFPAEVEEPCQRPSPSMGAPNLWPETFGQLLSTMKAQRNNLLRIFLTNSFDPTDSFPYTRHPEDNRFEVQKAVETGGWHEPYFTRLRTFAQEANALGVALQVCIFNFFDFRDDTWGFSPWNPNNAHDIVKGSGWSANHLVANGTPAQRCINFMDTKNEMLTDVKRAFINKVVATLTGMGNIILELMNEPRGPNGVDVREYKATFLSHTTKLILDAIGNWRPLLSANAFPSYLDGPPPFDVDVWRDKSSTIPNYDAIDLISYHGLSAISSSEPQCRKTVLFPHVDNASIITRRETHFRDHSRASDKKAMIFSTDGAKTYTHTYPPDDPNGLEMSIRDGQIRTSLPDSVTDPFRQRHQSDLGHWAYWCLREAVANPGRCHFQNHSSFYRSILYIKDAYAKATGATSGGNDFSPPFSTDQWTKWQWQNTSPSDFWTAVRLKLDQGVIVVQLGMVERPADESQAGAIEVGFLHPFNATSSSVRAVADYSPTAVSIRSSGALVIPSVALRLHAVQANGSVGALVKRQPVILQPGARPGRIELSAAVTAGKRYALILCANVGIQYQNRAQGYGEVIVSYPRVSLSG